MDEYLYMCGECLQFSGSIDEFIHHICPKSTASGNDRDNVGDSSKKDSVEPEHISLEPSISIITSKSEVKTTEDYVPAGQGFSYLYSAEDEETIIEGSGKKRKKYQPMADEYRVNRIMRDKDFKLGRTHLYNFKDTLGDWDEKSTKLLIQLIQKYPKSHFLLPTKAERRLGHWECIHQEMETAGYTFTVLQLRMRWREVLQKYRWTVDYNDAHKIKKKCEYFDEMNELFGDWDEEATHCLLKQMQQINMENHNKKIVRIGYVGWERITASLNIEGHRFSIDQAEARWRNMVTLFKTMVDHNALPNVEPRLVAYKDELEKLVNYAPKRRQIYEKVKGRSVKMERFPTNGIRLLLQAYKDCIDLFMDKKTRNNAVWDKIQQKLEEEGLKYTSLKLKDILNGIIKGYEKSQHHNRLPGAIRRDVPYFRELSEIFGVHGRWPHIQTSRTVDMRMRRKFRLRLQASQQLWSNEESRALLELYPDVLEAHVNQYASYQCSDLWLQVAKAYAATGFPKRDVPEVAVHIGLLRLGYSQNNLFPFREEMRKVKETEEAVCYSPDVSKFIGDVEVIYWSHNAVNHLLDLYLKHQEASSSQSRKDDVFARIFTDMQKLGYKYTKENILDHFKALLTQYRTRTSKLWIDASSSRKSSNPTGAPYLEKLENVFKLRRRLSLSWTSGVTPLDDEASDIVCKVALKEAEHLLKNNENMAEKKMLSQLLEQIQSHIRTKNLLEMVPRSRQIRLHLASALNNIGESHKEDGYFMKLHMLLKQQDTLSSLLKGQESHHVAAKPLKPNRLQNFKKREAGKKQVLVSERSSDDLSLDSVDLEMKFDNEGSKEEHVVISGKEGNEGKSERALCIHGQSNTDKKMQELTGESCIETENTSHNLSCASKRNKGTSCKSLGVIATTEQCGISDENSTKCDITNIKSYAKLSNEIIDNSNINSSAEIDVQGFASEHILCQAHCGDRGIPINVSSSAKSDCIDKMAIVNGNDQSNFCRKKSNLQFSENKTESDPYSTKNEGNTKVISTRSGRKTNFTFFTSCLREKGEMKGNMQFDRKDSYKMTHLNSKETNCSVSDMVVLGTRKRGRPRKVRAFNTLSVDKVKDTSELDYKLSNDPIHLKSKPVKSASFNDVMPGTRKRGRPCNIKADTLSKDANQRKSTRLIEEANPIPSKKRFFALNVIAEKFCNTDRSEHSCSSSSVDSKISIGDQVYHSVNNVENHTLTAALRKIETERKESETKLLSILGELHIEHNIILSKMLDMLQKVSKKINNV